MAQERPQQPIGFYSIECEDVVLDGPAQLNVRPIPPGPERERLMELRARLLAAESAGVDLSEEEALLDTPGDTSIRPCPSSMLDLLHEERRKTQAAIDTRQPSHANGRASNNIEDARPLPKVQYVCCFCAATISASQTDPVHLRIPLPEGANQEVAAHFVCLRRAIHPSVPLDLLEPDPEE